MKQDVAHTYPCHVLIYLKSFTNALLSPSPFCLPSLMILLPAPEQQIPTDSLALGDKTLTTVLDSINLICRNIITCPLKQKNLSSKPS